jgi:hypothetical protein
VGIVSVRSRAMVRVTVRVKFRHIVRLQLMASNRVTV